MVALLVQGDNLSHYLLIMNEQYEFREEQQERDPKLTSQADMQNQEYLRWQIFD